MAWSAISFASFAAFIIAIPMGWHYAKKWEWLRFVACLLVMIIAANSAWRVINLIRSTEHLVCPHCDDDGDQTDGN